MTRLKSGRLDLHAVGATPAGALEALIADTRDRHVLPRGPDAIVLEDLAKTYDDGTAAVRGITLRVAAGQSYGILGPNGAGKSTTIGILGTLVRPTAGRALVGGFDVSDHPMEVRRRIGFAMQTAGIDHFATPSELIVLQGRLHGLSKARAIQRASLLLAAMELEEVAHRRLATLSGGTQRRVDLAASLVHLPPILFLDEPTGGLDPRSRSAVWEAVGHLRRHLGLTVVLTTHHMEEAEQLCDRIAVVDNGRLVADDTPVALKAAVGAGATLEDVYLHFTGRPFEVDHAPATDEQRRAA